jgi:hypothetical protein
MNYRAFVSTEFDGGNLQFKVNRDNEELSRLFGWRFDTEEECILAISLWLNTPEPDRDINHFYHTFKNVLKMIGSSSSWTL